VSDGHGLAVEVSWPLLTANPFDQPCPDVARRVDGRARHSRPYLHRDEVHCRLPQLRPRQERERGLRCDSGPAVGSWRGSRR